MGFFKDAVQDEASRKSLSRMHAWIWASIYGGLILLVLGVFMQRGNGSTGWVLIALGAVVTAIGFVMIWLRSRMS